MKLWKLVVVLAGVGIIAGAVFGFAAPLTVTSDRVAAGGDSICSCDQDGIQAVIRDAYVNCEGFCVDTIVLNGISSDCLNAATLKARVVLTEATCDGQQPCSGDPGVSIYDSGEINIKNVGGPISAPWGPYSRAWAVPTIPCVEVEDVDDIHVYLRAEP